MYCVKCGVRLQEGTQQCPLCSTPVWNPDGASATPAFPDRYPATESKKSLWAGLLTLFFVIIAVALLVIWLNVGGGPWGSISLLGTAFVYIAFILPLWFKKMYAFIWLPVIHAVAAGYALFICCTFGGNWFLPFAFPMACIHALFTTTVSMLLHFIKGGRCYILGGSVIAYGGCTMLIEFFGHITFGTPMFVWSIYSASVLFAAGMFLIVVGIIKPFKRFLQKYLFF